MPTVLVVFGGTGDLFRRKLAPSLYTLFEEGKLPEHMLVLGTGRSVYTNAEYQQYTKDAIQEILGVDASDIFLKHFKYTKGGVETDSLYRNVSSAILEYEQLQGNIARICWYCSIGSHLYGAIAQGIKKNTAFLDREQDLNSFLIEKPIGHNEKSSTELNNSINAFFNETQITRIEHYLTKETLMQLPAFFKKHSDIRSILNGISVESIEVDFQETIGVEKRGAFYDTVGAFRDVGQNHMLEMLAISCMEVPEALNDASVRASRVAFLKQFSEKTKCDAKIVRYQHNNYRNIPGVDPMSRVETAFEIQDSMPESWNSITCIFKGGKKLSEKRKSITFKMRKNVTFNDKHLVSIVISIDPECVYLGYEDGTSTTYEFRPGHVPKYQYVEEYARILNAGFTASQVFSVSESEVTLLWRITDKYTSNWDTMTGQIVYYPEGLTPFIT